MYCPKCGDEFYEGFTECDGCEVALVEDPPELDSAWDIRFVSVLRTGSPVLLAIAKSMLDEAEIPYLAKGEGVQDLFGLGRLGTGFNPLTGPVDLQVDERLAAEARRVLADILEDVRTGSDPS